MNANDIVEGALRDLMVLPSGGTPTTAQYTDGRSLLNLILADWSAQLNMVYEDTLEELTIASGTQTFSIGPSGDQTSNRPLKIIAANLKDSNNNEYPLKCASDKQYNRFLYKGSTSIPQWIYLRKTMPNANIYFDCSTDKAYTLVLTSLKELTTFSDGTTDVALPNHYEYALRSNLKVRGAGMFGAAKRLTPMDYKDAENAKATIVGDALQINESTTELSPGVRYNIEAG